MLCRAEEEALFVQRREVEDDGVADDARGRRGRGKMSEGDVGDREQTSLKTE